jgi:hypothetical protein
MTMADQGYLDGNAAAGALGEIFSVDVTTATGRCVGCGRTGILADTRVWIVGSGLVVRCIGCDGVLLRVVSGRGRTWLDLSGLRYLELLTPSSLPTP